MTRPLALLAFLALAAAAPGGPRSTAVYPEQRILLRFDHRVHLEAGAACASCHPAAASDSPSDRLLPPEARCAACHRTHAGAPPGRAAASERCDRCHPGFDETVHRAPEPSLFPRAALHFSHARHLGRGATCATCHGALDDVRLATRADLPRMATCLACHDGRRAPARCALCHLAAQDARGAPLETDLPGGRLVPGSGDPLGLDHGPGFDRSHGLVAQGRRETCRACHAERECLRCHDGTTKPAAIHPGDYVSVHAVPARQNAPRCDDCHRRQSFCAPCHERVGVGAQADAPFRVPTARVHPPADVWVGRADASGALRAGPGHHGVQAARNIGQCASCHREEQCLECHATNSAAFPSQFPRGVSPHPPGFAASCRDLFRKNDRACRKCHAAGEAALAPCR